MSRVTENALVLGPFDRPLDVKAREAIHAMKLEASAQGLAHVEVTTRTTVTLTVALKNKEAV